MERADISIYTVDADEGCTVIRKGSQELFKTSEPVTVAYEFPFFDAHRKEILNLISPSEFRKMISMPWWKRLIAKI